MGSREGTKARESEGEALRLFDCRDGSASATYYFQDQSAAEIGNKSWLYLQSLKTEEEEMSVRSEQVRGSRRGGSWRLKCICKCVKACSCHLCATGGAPCSPASHPPKDLSEDSLRDTVPLMKSLDHSENKDRHTYPERRRYIFRNLLQ